MIITHTLEDWMWRLEDGKGWIRYTSKNIKGYTKRDNDVDGVDLYTEYKTGLGPEKSLMDQNHPMSKDIFRSLDFLSE